MSKTMSLNRHELLAEKYGFKMAPPDHPIYSEGPTIMFVSYRNKNSKRKNIEQTPYTSCKETLKTNPNIEK